MPGVGGGNLAKNRLAATRLSGITIPEFLSLISVTGQPPPFDFVLLLPGGSILPGRGRSIESGVLGESIGADSSLYVGREQLKQRDLDAGGHVRVGTDRGPAERDHCAVWNCSGPQGYQEARLALCQEQGRLEGEGEEVSHLTLHTDSDPLANALEPVAQLLCTPT